MVHSLFSNKDLQQRLYPKPTQSRPGAKSLNLPEEDDMIEEEETEAEAEADVEKKTNMDEIKNSAILDTPQNHTGTYF